MKTENTLHWQSLGISMRVIDKGTHFEAVDGDWSALIYWHNNEAVAAQKYLRKKASEEIYKNIREAKTDGQLLGALTAAFKHGKRY